jgi:hypothetical protein
MYNYDHFRPVYLLFFLANVGVFVMKLYEKFQFCATFIVTALILLAAFSWIWYGNMSFFFTVLFGLIFGVIDGFYLANKIYDYSAVKYGDILGSYMTPLCILLMIGCSASLIYSRVSRWYNIIS